MYLYCSLSVCLSVFWPSFSLWLCLSTHKSLTVTHSICDSPAPSIFSFLPLLVYIYASFLFFRSSTVLCHLLSHTVFLLSCMFVCFLLYLTQAPVSYRCCLSVALLVTRLSLCFLAAFFSFVYLFLYPAVCLSISLSLCVSRYSCRDFLTC